MKNEAAKILAEMAWKKRKRREGKDWKENLRESAKKGGQALAASRGADFYRELQRKSTLARKRRKEDKENAPS